MNIGANPITQKSHPLPPMSKENAIGKISNIIMKYKLLSVSTESQVNIGDYIQALASAQFLPHLDGFIQREKLKDYNEEECKVIMNGWYMHHPEQWPPSPKIRPLYVAVHFNTLAKEELFAPMSIEYLKNSLLSDAEILIHEIYYANKG